MLAPYSHRPATAGKLPEFVLLVVASIASACGFHQPTVASADALILAPQESGADVSLNGEAFRVPDLPPLAGRVLVVYNADLPSSTAIAKDYAKLRGVPPKNLCIIRPPSDTAVDIATYEETVKKPVRNCLESVGPRNILYIVLSYRTPFRVQERDGKVNLAVDSLLSDVWDEVVPEPFPERNLRPHPYYALHQSKANFFYDYVPLFQFRDRPTAPRIYSVWRLDAATEILASGLVRKALMAERDGPKGRGCFDRNGGPVDDKLDESYDAGEWGIERAADLARAAGLEVILDENHAEFGTEPAPARCEDALLYAGWYRLNYYNDAFSWANGAIGIHLDSLSALHPRSGGNWSANALQKGITVTSGAIDEPYLATMPQPDGVVHDLFQGAPVGDAFLRSTLAVKWRIIHIGDPLYRPFPKGLGPAAHGQPAGVGIGVPQARIPGGVQMQIVLSVGGDLSKERTVKFSTEPAQLARAPETLHLLPGKRLMAVTISTMGVENETPVRLSAFWDGNTATNSVRLLPLLQRLTIPSQQIRGGETIPFRLQVAAVEGSGEIRAAVRTDCPSVVTVPESIAIPVGVNVAEFEAKTSAVAESVHCVVELNAIGSKKGIDFMVVP